MSKPKMWVQIELPFAENEKGPEAEASEPCKVCAAFEAENPGLYD
jgi:hypothetical protein